MTLAVIGCNLHRRHDSLFNDRTCVYTARSLDQLLKKWNMFDSPDRRPDPVGHRRLRQRSCRVNTSVDRRADRKETVELCKRRINIFSWWNLNSTYVAIFIFISLFNDNICVNAEYNLYCTTAQLYSLGPPSAWSLNPMLWAVIEIIPRKRQWSINKMTISTSIFFSIWREPQVRAKCV